MELLAPAGSPASVEAAVAHGADAVYLGFGAFNARRNAKNFSLAEFEAAVSLCHTHGVKVYLTLNTLLTDRELASAAASVRTASALGVDAVLVQDLGALELVRRVAPDLPVHASTQMSIHNLEGAVKAFDLGVTRVVLARELPKEEMAYLCAHSPVEMEVFVHGALCVCYSGQCYFSSVIGGRSGNRGLCAQPCRLPYGFETPGNAHPLSLKDMSLVRHLKELEDMGVACVKIEGRMKRPEYVSVVTSVYARAIRDGKEPSKEEMAQLRAAFSRQGFTDGYYQDQTGSHMFGVRDEASKGETVSLEGLYLRPPVPLRGAVSCLAEEPCTLTAEDDAGHRAVVSGPVPELARAKETTKEQIAGQIQKTGGSPYAFSALDVQVSPGLFLPVSAINRLRRDAFSALTEARTQPPARREGPLLEAPATKNRALPPGFTVSVKTIDQLTKSLLDRRPIQIYLPLEEGAKHPGEMKRLLERGIPVAVSLPRVIWSREWAEVNRQLDAVQALGVQTALVGNLGQVEPLRSRGFRLRGDFGLNVYNSHTLKTLKGLSFLSATLSFELRLPKIRDLSKPLDTELLVYGRLPLMVTEQCLIRNRTGRCGCAEDTTLTDRTGARFPVLPEPFCRNVIYNANTLFLADKQADYAALGLWGARLSFTTESPEDCARVAAQYWNGTNEPPSGFTRGLYYREVE
ncbi:MAG: DUF3656 domain-containing U32 family peptidase [Oscillospiraceae bacterium]|jgi:putative protease